jgi:hypothetical protein
MSTKPASLFEMLKLAVYTMGNLTFVAVNHVGKQLATACGVTDDE